MNITPSIQNFFKEQEVEIVLFPSTQTRKFLEIEEFVDFFTNEYTFWKNCTDGRLNDVRVHFLEIYNRLNIQESNEDQIVNHLKATIISAKINDKLNPPAMLGRTE